MTSIRPVLFAIQILWLTSTVAAAPLHSIRISVSTNSGEAIQKMYVALVPPERPWSRPLVERTVEGSQVTLEVPAGRYSILAGAPGHGIQTADEVTVDASRKNEARLTLPPLHTIRGVVVDSDGNPRSNVTVGEVSAFIEPLLGRFSELATQTLGADWRTETGDDGAWTLSVAERSTNPLIAFGHDSALTWHTFEPGSSTQSLVLPSGGAIRATLDRADPGFVLTLIEKTPSPAVPPAWQAQIYGRKAATTSVVWSSLRTGDYDIYAQQTDPATFSAAEKIGTVTVEAGRSGEVRLVLPASKPRLETELVLVERLQRFDAASFTPFGTDRRGLPRKLRAVSERVTGGILFYVDANGTDTPYFATTQDRFFAFHLHDASDLQRAEAFDLGGAAFLARSSAPGTALPAAARIVFDGCGETGQISISAEVEASGRIAFAAPAGCTSFVVHLDPFSPLIFPRELPFGDPVWLGEFVLHASGRAAVHVVHEEGSPIENALVRVTAPTDAGLQSHVVIAERATAPDGWARFDNLPAGRELAISARGNAGTRSRIESTRVEPGQEVLIDPLRLRSTATLVVDATLHPQFLADFPKGGILSLFLQPLETGAERSSVANDAGDRVTFRDVAPGSWQLGAIVTTGQGNQPMLLETVTLKSGEFKQIETTVKPLVFRGRVIAPGQDLSGNIDILSSRRSDAVPSVPLNAAGEFVALLPRRDTYFVGVRTRATGRLMWVGNTAFVDPAQPVEILLPRGEVNVRVLAEGKPMAKVPVMARMGHEPTIDVPLIALPVLTGANGEAKLDGLLPGPWVVFLAASQIAQKSVTIGNEPVNVTLDATPGLPITGAVLDSFGTPVPNARVLCLLPGPDGLPYMRSTFTGSDGSFDLGDRMTTRASVLCSVTSFAGAQAYRVIAGDPARLTLPSEPASLRIVSLPPMDRFSSLWLVARDGRIIDVSSYAPRVAGNSTLDLPAIPAESWKLVSVASPAEWRALTLGGASTLPAIGEVILKPGERKQIDLKGTGTP